MRPYIDRKLDGGLQHCSPALPAGLPLTERIHQRPISIRRVSGLIGPTPGPLWRARAYLASQGRSGNPRSSGACARILLSMTNGLAARSLGGAAAWAAA